jgi:hypothetical protein
MMMSPNDLSEDTTAQLRTRLAAKGLPIWGTREVLIERLNTGGQKKKPGPKTGSKKDTFGNMEPGELKFYNEQRPKLVALGITDPTTLKEELTRLWNLTKKQSKPKQQVKNTFMSDTVINSAAMTSAGLKLISVDTSSGKNQYFGIFTRFSPRRTTTTRCPRIYLQDLLL